MSASNHQADVVPKLTCVLHHHIGLETDFERGLNVCSSLDAYQAHIDWLTNRYNVISLATLLSGELPQKPLLMTFDDAFKSSFIAIKDILAPRGLPSVFFVNPGMLSDRAISLDSTLAWASHTVGLSSVCQELGLPLRDNVGQIVVGDMAHFCAAQRNAVRDQLLNAFGPPNFAQRAPLMTAQDLATLPSLGAEIGNHTNHHVHCRSLTDAELQSEIIDAKTELEAISGQTVRSFSVPYGHENDLTGPVLSALRASGHQAIFLVHARSNAHRPSADIWYRVSLHNEAVSNLRTELSIKPPLRSFKHWVSGGL